MKIKNVLIVLIQIVVFGLFYYFLHSGYPCESLKKEYGAYQFNIKIDTIYTKNSRYLILSGVNAQNVHEEFEDVASYLFQRKTLFSVGDTLIKKKGELFFELRKAVTGEKKIINIECK
jgi:hypothetical protein